MAIGSTPTKIPAAFVAKTLARLLPPMEEIALYDKDQMLALMEQKLQLEQLIKAEPIRFWRPNPGGQHGFSTDDSGKRCIFYFAGNKSGKTTAADIRFCERLAGRALWDVENRKHITYPTPARGAIFAEDFDSHKEVSIPTIQSWMPKGFIVHETRNSAGHVVEHRLYNGSLIHYRTYDQGSDKAEGKDWHIVLFDEPPPRLVYTAAFRGIVATDGIMLIAATLLKETWLYDEITLPHVAHYGGDIDDNVWLSSDAKKDFLASLTDDEREVRKSGKPSSLVGVVYKGFHDGAPWVQKHEIPPDHCPIVMAVDPHERKPCHVAWLYVTPENENIFFDWAFVGGSATEIRDQLRRHELMFPSSVRVCIMDPNRGKARQIQYANDAPQCWQEVFEGFGYDVILGNDNVNYGHTQVKNMLESTVLPDGRVLPPRLRFTEACRGPGGPIFQLLRYSWEDWSNRTRMERDVKEKVRDKHKDFPDVIRYVACADLDYNELRHGPKIIDLWPGRKIETANQIRAYA